MLKKLIIGFTPTCREKDHQKITLSHKMVRVTFNNNNKKAIEFMNANFNKAQIYYGDILIKLKYI
jgi:hypothetical protein